MTFHATHFTRTTGRPANGNANATVRDLPGSRPVSCRAVFMRNSTRRLLLVPQDETLVYTSKVHLQLTSWQWTSNPYASPAACPDGTVKRAELWYLQRLL